MSINESRQGRYKSCVILAEIMHFHEQPRRRNSQRRFAALRHPIFFFFFLSPLLTALRSTIGQAFPFLSESTGTNHYLSFPVHSEYQLSPLLSRLVIPHVRRLPSSSSVYWQSRIRASRSLGDARCYVAIPLNGCHGTRSPDSFCSPFPSSLLGIILHATSFRLSG